MPLAMCWCFLQTGVWLNPDIFSTHVYYVQSHVYHNTPEHLLMTKYPWFGNFMYCLLYACGKMETIWFIFIWLNRFIRGPTHHIFADFVLKCLYDLMQCAIECLSSICLFSRYTCNIPYIYIRPLSVTIYAVWIDIDIQTAACNMWQPQSHTSHNTPFLQQKCGRVCTFLSQNGALWDIGICIVGLLR